MDSELRVRDDRQHGRFVADVDGHTAELSYDLQPGRIILVHTGVPEAVGGRGVGGRLVQAAAARAESEQLTVVPRCSFAQRWLENHAEVASRLSVDWAPPR